MDNQKFQKFLDEFKLCTMMGISDDNEQRLPELRAVNVDGRNTVSNVTFHAWEVVLFDAPSGCYMQPRIVLAATAEDAVSQATSLLPSGLVASHREEIEKASRVRQVPLMIRGWGRREF